MIDKRGYKPQQEARLLLPLINRILDHQADRKALLEQASDFKISFDLPETSPDEIFPLFTVKKKGVILGYLSAEMPDPVSDSNYLFIRQMSVRMGHEGNGNGRVLLNEAKGFIDRARLDGAIVWAHEPRAKAFYVREGFDLIRGAKLDLCGNSLFRFKS